LCCDITKCLLSSYPSSNSRLVSPLFTVPPTNQFPRFAVLALVQSWRIDGRQPDFGQVEVKAGTNAWKIVSPQYSEGSGGWTYASVDLSTFAGQAVQLAFHMVAASSSSGAGWYVDDIKIENGRAGIQQS